MDTGGIPEDWRATLQRAAQQEGRSYPDFLASYIASRKYSVQKGLSHLTYLRDLIGDPPLNTSQEIEAAAEKIISRKPQSWRTKSEEVQKFAGIQRETEALERELAMASLMLE